MTDQVLMDNYLLLLKSTVEVYVHGTLESSTSEVRELLHSCLNNTISMQGNTFDMMAEAGWYQVDNVSCNNIKKVYDKVKKI